MKRSAYSMMHQVATCSQLGRLCPTMIQEVSPGDTWSGKTGILVRLSPLKRALLIDIHVDQFAFYIPHRLVMADWEDFIAAGPDDTPAFSIPTVSLANPVNTLECLFMAPPNSGQTAVNYSALRLFAYNLVFNEYFRDDSDTPALPTAHPGIFGKQINYKKQYWTELSDVLGFSQADQFVDSNAGSGDQVSATEILRAIQRQKVAMKRATYGTRYVDILRSYGINVNYQMLQRPELVGLSRGSINITDVVASDGANLGDLAGHGISGNRLQFKRKTFPEHGTLMSFVTLRPIYADPRVNEWFDLPRTYDSFYDPGLVPLPPVAVQKQDVQPNMDDATRADILGFQPWGEQYRKSLSRVHVLLQDWTGAPELNGADFSSAGLRNFSSAVYDTIFSSTSFGHYQVSAVHKFQKLSLLPKGNVMLNIPV